MVAKMGGMMDPAKLEAHLPPHSWIIRPFSFTGALEADVMVLLDTAEESGAAKQGAPVVSLSLQLPVVSAELSNGNACALLKYLASSQLVASRTYQLIRTGPVASRPAAAARRRWRAAINAICHQAQVTAASETAEGSGCSCSIQSAGAQPCVRPRIRAYARAVPTVRGWVCGGRDVSQSARALHTRSRGLASGGGMLSNLDPRVLAGRCFAWNAKCMTLDAERHQVETDATGTASSPGRALTMLGASSRDLMASMMRSLPTPTSAGGMWVNSTEEQEQLEQWVGNTDGSSSSSPGPTDTPQAAGPARVRDLELFCVRVLFDSVEVSLVNVQEDSLAQLARIGTLTPPPSATAVVSLVLSSLAVRASIHSVHPSKVFYALGAITLCGGLPVPASRADMDSKVLLWVHGSRELAGLLAQDLERYQMHLSLVMATVDRAVEHSQASQLFLEQGQLASFR